MIPEVVKKEDNLSVPTTRLRAAEEVRTTLAVASSLLVDRLLQLLRCFTARHRGKGTCSIGLLRRVAWGSSVTVTTGTATSATSSLVCFNLYTLLKDHGKLPPNICVTDLSPRVPYFESYRLEKPVPDIEENRNHYAGHTHHFS